MFRRPRSRALVATTALGLIASPLALLVTAAPAQAAGEGLVINEVYVNGGSAGATYTNKYVELFNPTDAPIDLAGSSIQYRSPTGTGASGSAVALTGTVSPGGYFTISGGSNGANGVAVPGADQVAGGSWNPGAGGGTVTLASVPTAVDPSAGTNIVDKVGWGTSNAPEGTAASGNSVTLSLQRDDAGTDTNDNSVDFSAATPTPDTQNPGAAEDCAGELTIAEIQGTEANSPCLDDTVTTEGVVTATYATGGFNGFYIQTPGEDTTPGASDGLFVYGPSFDESTLAIGDSVEVEGTVSEFSGLTEITAGTVTDIASLGTVVPNTTIPGTDCALPGTGCLTGAALEAAKEEVEGELFQPSGDFTVTDAYDGSAYNGGSSSSSFFGEIGLAANSGVPLVTPTEVIDAQATADIAARKAYNDAHRVILDDGSSTTYWNTGGTGQMDQPFPWFTPDHTVRVGAGVEFPAPVVLDYRFGWKLQPQGQVVGAPTGKVTFEQDRPATPEDVGGDLKLATFNVLNYFTTLGHNTPGCTSFNDRAGNPVAVSGGCSPRGAWDPDDFERQEAKIVAAINTMDADIVSLEEIENSLVVDAHDRDEALSTLVAALNEADPGRWAFAESPETLPDGEDVIRTAFIYDPATVEVVGEGALLTTGTAFDNAREPYAQAFKPAGSADAAAFAVIANHFKSKGSGVNDGTGQGNANPDRIAQAEALSTFAADFATARGVEAVFLTGDFNSYSMEDPMQVLYGDGYTKLESDTANEHSYSFDGQSGSLDHVLGNEAATAMVSGVDIWEINANETVFNQYSRYNYNATILYDEGPFSASDHNPEIVGIDLPDGPATEEIQILGTNDFHGRIQANGAEAGAAVLAGAVEQLRTENPNTVFAAAGDLIGASTFESFIAKDKPTIDVLNKAGLEVSAVGNHEFDQGYEDLVTRVMAPYDPDTNPLGGAQWKYLGANVQYDGPLPGIDATWIRDFGDVQVGFVGAVTEDLPSLVSAEGMAGVTVTDIVESTNTAADQLKADGAELVVLLVHEGAPGTDCAAMDDDPESSFGSIVTGVNDNVDAIVSGHTHLAYNCSFPVEGWVGRAVTERPVVSAGQYGTNLNQLVFEVDPATGEVVAKSQALLALAGNYPADPETQQIVTDAVAEADVLGAEPLGEIGGPFFRAKLSNGSTENRGGESTLGNLVAEVQQTATEDPAQGGAQIAFMNPGGLRADMVGTVTDGYPETLTYKQAATVQPFANTLVNMDLTGAKIKEALEQQWQPAGSSRPFLKLGISEGFTYTYDADAAQGERITGMWLDGEPIDLAASYSVTVNSFLATGTGDNFFAFGGGTDKKDTGQIDLQAMVDYMADATAEEPLPVDYSQRAVGVDFPDGAPSEYEPGSQVSFDLSSLSMSGPGDTTDSEVSVSLGGTDLGTSAVTTTVQTALPGFDEAGTASVTITLPDNTPAGTAELVVTGNNTGTTTTVPVTVAAVEPPDKVEPTVTAQATPTTLKVKKDTSEVTVSVTADGVTPTGKVEAYLGQTKVGQGTLTNGSTSFEVGPFSKVGPTQLSIRYLGDDAVEAGQTTLTLTVQKQRPKVSVDLDRTIKKGARPTAGIELTAENLAVTGAVRIGVLGKSVTRRLSGGATQVRLPKINRVGEVKVRVQYLGNDSLVPVLEVITVRVRR